MNYTDADHLHEMVEGYLRCALWSWLDEDGSAPFGGSEDDTPLTEVFDTRSIVIATQDCRDFCDYVAWETEGLAATDALAAMDPTQAGHDFWLTRERHGAGFWDRGLGDAGRQLTDASHLWGDGGLMVERQGDGWKAFLS